MKIRRVIGSGISRYLAAKTLRITQIMLKTWCRNKAKILGQTKGSRRARHAATSTAREPILEEHLHREYRAARDVGRSIGARWFLRRAKFIYAELYPHRILRDSDGRRTYLGFKFSNGWFQLFKRRYNISLRCKTKQAQKAPPDYQDKILSWLRFNRRNTVITEHSNCGKLRGPEIPVLGRFKLSEIANMDQTPIVYEFLSSKTYEDWGKKTVWIKEARSGWDRRQATLQVHDIFFC